MKPIAVDAMGGDQAPQVNLEGALMAEQDGLPVVLVGAPELLEPELRRRGSKIQVVAASDFIRMDEHATDVRKRKEASINVAMQLLKDQQASAVVSLGHSGATLASALFTLGRLPGVERPALVVEMPCDTGRFFLCDGGANADCRPEYLVQFAQMATGYARARGHAQPRVGLLSIGEEEGKGNQLTNAAYPLLRQAAGIEFYGNVEGRDLPRGTTEVVVCDGYTGNVVLKLFEGEARVLLGWVRQALTSSWVSRLGALLVRPALQQLRKRIDPSEYGAMPLLGVRGPVFIGHGSGNARAVQTALHRAHSTVQEEVVDKIAQIMAP